jgi:hydrogenase expression/formation protein HypC
MCLAIPARVLTVEGQTGTVDLEGSQLAVNFSFVEGVEPGQHVLIHAGFALQVIDEAEAAEIEFYLRQMRDAAAESP